MRPPRRDAPSSGARGVEEVPNHHTPADDTWGKVPYAIFRANLSGSAKDVFCIMSIHANSRREAWMTQETIARLLDWWWSKAKARYDTTRVRRAQAELEAAGFVCKIGKHKYAERRWSWAYVVAPYGEDAVRDTASSEKKDAGDLPTQDAGVDTASTSAGVDTAQTEVQTIGTESEDRSKDASKADRRTDQFLPLNFGTHPSEEQWREALGLPTRKGRKVIRSERFASTDDEARTKRERARPAVLEERTEEAKRHA